MKRTQQPGQAQQQTDTDSEQQQQTQNRPGMGLGAALLQLTFIGLASPFLELQDPLHGLIGLVILFVGIRIAWKIAAGTETQILGPFENAPAAS